MIVISMKKKKTKQTYQGIADTYLSGGPGVSVFGNLSVMSFAVEY